ncbi:MAG: glutamyl-tRNA(Gln) amidotransferase subunit E [Zestosphaera tikiterensis]|uniref:Glutamyl-tRNA(Gln) amidotransferase subunit E n=1 Tax=Zestosphaera tikiterensis TaxID=1973259 RepID=A0A2R7Y688_9CREN|nr:MAG: glutamyl-tRNA(Gln) amidotransferase subunit E [Zestosphaera tikiterensis]
MMEINYEELGLKVGLEIHQQLATKGKLFCSCSTSLASESTPKVEVSRYLRVAKSEIGEVDPAALYEMLKGRKIIYEVPRGHACLVELDEEPPHPINMEAVLITLGIVKALNAKPVDEVYVMRKIVIDGSNTSGFQRTAVVGVGGFIEDENGRVGIQTICLEEDAARKVDEGKGYVKYNLDRLGIPLVEISTAPDIKSPEQALRVAFKLGLLLRLTGKVKRGIGTIRQDLNVSIKGGSKIEIKGVSKLELIPKVIEYEVMRQLKLLEIRDELIKRGLSSEELTYVVKDVTQVFVNTKSNLVRNALSKGLKVYALPLKGFNGILKVEVQPGRRFGTELSDYAKAWGGVGGIIHSDELPAYGISAEEKLNVFKVLNLDESRDAYVLTLADDESAERALQAVFERVKNAFVGVPKETRAANPDGTTKYMRPQPGASRMYPETDIPPLRISEELLKEAEKLKPPTPDELLSRLVKEHNLPKPIAEALVRDPLIHTYLNLVESFGRSVAPHVIASTLMIHLKGLKSQGFDVSLITEEVLEKVFEGVGSGLISKDSIPEILKEYLSSKGSKSVEELVKAYAVLRREDLEKIVDEVIERNRESILAKESKAFNIVMGEVMRVVRGKIDGKIVADVVREKLSAYLKKK